MRMGSAQPFKPLYHHDSTQQAMAFSRADLVFKPIDLRDVVRAAIVGTEPMLIERRHTLAAHICLQELPVLADAARLGALVAYLIRTAAHHASGRGLITIRTWLDGWQACVCVADNGQGLAGDLSIARRMVEVHGGQIETVPSGEGISVFLRLPVATAASIQ